MATPELPTGMHADRKRTAEPPDPPAQLLGKYITRELIIFGGALLVGLVGIPLLTWLVGNRILGPYTHGQDMTRSGPMVLLGDFMVGLGHGSVIFWAVALGPVLIVLLVRLIYRLYRSVPTVRG